MIRSATAKALPILTIVLAGWPLAAQVEQGAVERRQRLERLEVLDRPLVRVVLPEQQLVAWVPESFELRQKTATQRSYSEPDLPANGVSFFRQEIQPGLGLIHAWEMIGEGLRANGFLQQVESLRQLDLAGRPALEVVALTEQDGQELSMRMVLSIDPEQPYLRKLFIHCLRDRQDWADALLGGLLRDWTPLDGGSWDSGFERLRSRLITEAGAGAEPLPWAERNRLLDAAGKPAAIGQPWVGQRLRSLAGGRPALLLDGLLHHHPRVRIACLEALMAIAADPSTRQAVLVRALRDSDPIVRFTGARLAAAEPGLAAGVLRRILGVDHPVARSGAFQLLAVIDEEHRRQLIGEAFAERDQYPARSQALLASLLGEWGSESAGRSLLSAWKRATADELRHAALGELLLRDHPEVLAYARRRLAEPSRQDPLSVTWATRFLIAGSEAGTDVEHLHQLAAGLASEEQAVAGAEDAAPKPGHGWAEAAEKLRGFAEHLRGLPAGVTAEDECRRVAELLADEPWAWSRSGGLGCTEPDDSPSPARFLEVEVPQPGSLILSLRDLLDRLQLGSQEEDRFYRTLLDFMFKSLEDTFADPISARSTGLDMATAWRWQSFISAEAGFDLSDPAPDTTVTVRCTDPERCLHLLVRGVAGDIPLEDMLREGVVVSAMLPLLPAMLANVWDDQRQISLGEDSADAEQPAEAHLALVRQGELWKLRRLKQFRRQTPSWSTVLTARVDGHQLTLSPHWHPDEAEPEEPESAGETAGTSDPSRLGLAQPGEVLLDLDLAAVLRSFQSDDDQPWVQRLIDAGARMTGAFGFDGAELATTFTVSGLPATWLDVARNRPAGELRAPVELLPAGTLAWAGISLDAQRFAQVLRDEPESWTSAFEEVDAERLLELAAAAGPEIGLAVIGVPEPAENAWDAWSDRLLVYLMVEPRAAQRFLDDAMTESTLVNGNTVYRQGSLWAARSGDFLILASNERAFAELDAGPRLATTAFYDQIIARSPAEVAAVAALHVDLFAQSLIDRLPADPEVGMTRMAVEFLRAFGPVVAWWGRRGDLVEGRVSLRPNLLSEAARERVRRLVGYVGYISGSIQLDAFATRLEPDSIEQLELELELADAAWSLSTAGDGEQETGAGGRLRLEPSAAGTFELISRAAVALPESSSLSLPIEGAHLAPYLRAERGLGLRAQEIRQLARDIRGDQDDPARIVRAVIEWVGDNLEYRSVTGTENTAEILASRQADCTEFSQLTIALCRSLGIPARGVSGASLGGEVAILHRWAEVYLDRWYEIDPTNGQTRVPARTLRLPGNGGAALASTPGNRLRLQAARAADGGLARRLSPRRGANATTLESPDGGPGGRIEIAATGDQALVAYAAPPQDDGPADVRLLHSKDGGEQFSAVSSGAALGELVDLAGGHGRLLWLGRGDDGQSRVHELAADGWQDLSAHLRQELSHGLGVEPDRWSMAAVAKGFLVLAAGDPPRAALLDPELRFERQLALPPGLGDAWVLGHDRPLVAHATDDGGVALIEWQGREWATLVDFSDAAGLVPQRLRTTGPRVEVVCHDPERDRQTVLWWSAATGKHNRQTPLNGVPVQDSVTAGGWVWQAWRDGDGWFFSRRSDRPRP